MQQLRRLSLAGLALLLGAPLEAAAQDDSGTLEVLVEDPSGPRSPDGTPSLTFETRTVLNLEKVDIGPGRPVTDPGQRIGTGSGTVITPTVTESDLVTEPSVYPQKFRHVTKDAQGRIWATAKEPHGLYVFSDSTSWQRVSSGTYGAQELGRDAQGKIWVIGNRSDVYRISGNTLTEYSGFRDLGVGSLSTFAAGRGDTVWMGGYVWDLGGVRPGSCASTGESGGCSRVPTGCPATHRSTRWPWTAPARCGAFSSMSKMTTSLGMRMRFTFPGFV